MKVALVHDYLKEFGGAERVLEAMHEVWPDAPIFTAFVDWEGLGPHAGRLKNWDIRTSWVQKVWLVKKLHSPLRFLAPLVWESFNFDEYDVVITSSAWYIPRGIVTKQDTIHICYLHAPPRHLYGYETAVEWQRYLPIRVYGHLVNHFLRMYDYLAAQRVDWFIANSEETKKRIEKFYRREAEVIYPPVELKWEVRGGKCEIAVPVGRQEMESRIDEKEIKKSRSQNISRRKSITSHFSLPTSYYLCVSRLARAKHIDLAIEACQKLGEPLVIVGKGREEERLKSIVKCQRSNVTFLGEVDDTQLHAIYAGAKALIFPAVDEEFGIVPVEAMAHGVPVVAFRSGGVQETVVEGKTGVFFAELSVEAIIKALQHPVINALHLNGAGKNIKAIKPSDCIKQAKKFSKERFKKAMEAFIQRTLQTRVKI